MILVDTTIVSTAMPAIMRGLDTGISGVVWVNSAYLLAFAVPLLITGRLGDRYGPKNVYLAGLAVFTAASLWCGLAPSIGLLVAARVVQGLGAALMTPQTMTVITRMFPAQRRGPAMGLWGSVAGVATLVGPVLGGVLVDTLGWEWIFFVNVPVGIVAFRRALAKVPQLERHAHRLDWLGVALSSVAMFLIVFGIQEGNTYDWDVIAGGVGVWHLLAGGLVVMVLFVLRQHFTRGEPLMPLRLFHDRNFSLANVAITGMGLTVVSMSFPIVLYLQSVRGLTPDAGGPDARPDGRGLRGAGSLGGQGSESDGSQNDGGAGLLAARRIDHRLRPADRARHPVLGAVVAAAHHGLGRCARLAFGVLRGHAQPRSGRRRRGVGGVQHHAAGRFGAWLGTDRSTHGVADRGRVHGRRRAACAGHRSFRGHCGCSRAGNPRWATPFRTSCRVPSAWHWASHCCCRAWPRWRPASSVFSSANRRPRCPSRPGAPPRGRNGTLTPV